MRKRRQHKYLTHMHTRGDCSAKRRFAWLSGRGKGWGRLQGRTTSASLTGTKPSVSVNTSGAGGYLLRIRCRPRREVTPWPLAKPLLH
jgi:hypothetical protein